jgi:hypothetical protein
MRWPWSRRRPTAAPRHAAWSQPAAPPPVSVVHLGFTDGSELELTDSDPAALALQAVADVLLRQEPHSARQ